MVLFASETGPSKISALGGDRQFTVSQKRKKRGRTKPAERKETEIVLKREERGAHSQGINTLENKEKRRTFMLTCGIQAKLETWTSRPSEKEGEVKINSSNINPPPLKKEG